jgi:aminomethyltransferase
MSLSTPHFNETYHQALDSALAVRHRQPDVLQITGSGRLSFLHRMTTNALEDLHPWTLRSTTLTTPLARTIDRLWIVHREDDLLALTSPNRGQIVHSWLTRHIFFNDDIQLTALNEEWSLWGIYGPDAAQQITENFGVELAAEPDAIIAFNQGLAMRWSSPKGVRLLLTPPGETLAADRWPLAESQTAAEVFNTLRIEAGYPLFGSEFNEDSLPLEAGLHSTIDVHKGCYTGQEIIARMDSRGQLARRLVGFHLDGPCPPGKLITSSGQRAGELTSCAHSPRLGWIGLGVVKTQFLENGSAFVQMESGQSARWLNLPFDTSG